MTDEEIVSEILSLPENLQKQVLQYIEFLKYKNSIKDEKEKSLKVPKINKLADDVDAPL